MTLRLVAAFGLVLALSFVTLSPAANQDEDESAIFRAAVEMVNVLCTVSRGDQYVQGLVRDDFEVFENGVRQEIHYFTQESDDDAQPLNIVLLIDTSGSVKDMLMFQQRAAKAFLESTLRPQRDMAAVIQFDSEITLVQDFTYDLELLHSSIRGIRAGGATKLYDAVYVAVDDALRHEVGRRIMVVLSDGDDTQSVLKDQDAIQAAQAHDVMIFGVGVRSSRFRADFGKLRQFARETGGLFFNSRARLDDLEDAFARINAAIKNQYSVGYVSTNPARDGSFREIEVRVGGRGLNVSHRKGYYAGKPQP
jgi:Ca-activated chloride channel homolog